MTPRESDLLDLVRDLRAVVRELDLARYGGGHPCPLCHSKWDGGGFAHQSECSVVWAKEAHVPATVEDRMPGERP